MSNAAKIHTTAPPHAPPPSSLPMQLFHALAALVDEALGAALDRYDPDNPDCGETFLCMPDTAADCRKVFKFIADVFGAWDARRAGIHEITISQLRQHVPAMLPARDNDLLSKVPTLITATAVSWPFRQAAIWANGALRCLRADLRDHDDAAVEAAAIACKSVLEILESDLMPCHWTQDLETYLDGMLGVEAEDD